MSPRVIYCGGRESIHMSSREFGINLLAEMLKQQQKQIQPMDGSFPFSQIAK